MRRMKKWLGVLFCLAFCLLLSSRNVSADGIYPYEISSYHVNMSVTKQNVYHIEETIQVYFNNSRHGIYRDIPLINQVSRADGSKGMTRAKLQNVSCHGDSYSTSRSGKNYRLKIGDEDQMILGEKTYVISYDYVMKKDILEGADEFYYNVIGTGWDTTIQNVTFSIEMPDAVDGSKLGMSYGSPGSVLTDGLRYGLAGNLIEGELDPSIILEPGEGVTVRLELPDGYFVEHKEIPWSAYLTIVIAIIGMAIAFGLWWRFGRDDPVVDVVGFHPPSALNSLETALAYKGEVDSEDVVSLVVYLAQKGYIEIQEGAKSGLFTLVKKKEYDGNNEVERIFMQGLFAKGDTVRKKDLQNSFYRTCNKIVGKMNSKRNQKILFHENSINKHWILYLLTIIMFYAALYQPLLENGSGNSSDIVQRIFVPLLLGGLFVLGFKMLFRPSKLIKRLIPFAFCMCFILNCVLILWETFLYMENIYCFSCGFCVVASAVIMFFDEYLPKRTRYGTEVLGHIRGFKTFLETAEKERLEAMVEEDPEYFYNILPYTYVLGVSDKWMKKFESIVVEPPQWYASHEPYRTFHMASFSRNMNRTLDAAKSSMTSTPSSSSGGGHSGGGSGGGGGGSW